MALGEFAAVMDGLVSDARSQRDHVVNRLDAVERETRAAAAEVRQQGRRSLEDAVAGLRRSGSPVAADEVSEDAARFIPEDEWERTGANGSANGSAGSSTVRQSPDARRSGDDDEDYPETWLR